MTLDEVYDEVRAPLEALKATIERGREQGAFAIAPSDIHNLERVADSWLRSHPRPEMPMETPADMPVPAQGG